MTANPDALRRAADEMEAQSARVERLVADVRERADRIHEVRLELARAGFPVDEGAWPTDQLRALVDAYLTAHPARAVVVESLDMLSAAGLRSGDLRDRLRALIADRAALLAADDPMIAELIAILGGACLPSEIVGRVRDLKIAFDCAKDRARSHHDLIAKLHAALNAAGVGLPDGTLLERVGDISRRLEAVTLDRDSLVGKLDAMRAERDDLRKTIAKCQTACDSAGIAIRSDISERVCYMAAELSSLRQKRDALRAPKVAAVEWDGFSLIINGKTAASVGESLARPGVWIVACSGSPGGEAVSEESARKLAELLANHDPGGVWRVNGDVVSPDTVRMVCPLVAVTWGEP